MNIIYVKKRITNVLIYTYKPKKRVSGTSLEWCISDKEHKFNTSNQNLQSCTKHKPCIHPDTISPTFNFFKRSNGRMSGSFNDKIKRAEKLQCPEAISAFSLNTASNKTSLPDVDVNRANSGIRDFEKEDSRIGSKEKRLLSHSDTEQSGDKQIIQGYEHPAFSFSSENDNNGSKFYVGKTSSYVKSSVNNNIWSKFYDGETHNYSKSSVNNNSRSTFYGGKACNYVGSSINNFCNAYSKTRRRISFSDSTEDEINDKDTCCLNRIKSPRETLLRTGYFLNVRKTKHFYLPTKTENAHTVDKLQQHHNPSSKTRESNESWFKKDSDHRSLAEYIYIEKPKQRKRKATLQMKQISSENESEEFGREYSYINNQNMRRKQDGVSAKIKERLFIETDSQNGGKSNRLTFSIKNCPTHISITGNGNLRLESESPENEKIYWIRNSGSSLNEEDILSSSPPAGSSDDENFHFHGSTDTSSDGEFSSEYNSKQRNPERRISTSPSSCISETHQIHSESDISVANDDEKTENSTAVWKTSLDDTRDNFREFAGNVEQDENGADDYLITAENIIQNHVNLENSKSKIYHLKYGNINLRFYDTPRNHVTLRLISENECPQTDWHSKEKRNSEHYLAIKELKPTSFDKEESYSAFGSDVDSSIDEASASDASPAFKKSEDLEEAASSHIGKNKTTDTETIKFDFIPDKGISEIKFRRMPAVTYLQYKSEKTKLYFKKKYS
ncbi:uncharacterized protein LOC129218109 [Uloborus diversus]|uniref:uncharacterized protein LOC129218109 n=1 Tax=Uloborus diversus TaxID=327109 RepID=UPI00240A2500|nr:uncharacterized protein LOC129218109 [Uloborus diversus]